jgi:hypothetical protein
VPRVQRRVRVLEDHLHVAAERTHGTHGNVGDVAALEDHLAAGRLEQRGDQRPVVDLPQPDSPTRPSVSPVRTAKSIPSTARHRADLRLKKSPG